MKLHDQDSVPSNFLAAANAVILALNEEELELVRSGAIPASAAHHTVGQMIRNAWSLWNTQTPLVRFFRETYKVQHADDVSSIIIEGAFAKIKGERFNPHERARACAKHWEDMGLNSFGEETT